MMTKNYDESTEARFDLRCTPKQRSTVIYADPAEAVSLISGLRTLVQATIESGPFVYDARGVLQNYHRGADGWIRDNYDKLRGLLVTVSSVLNILDDTLEAGYMYMTDGEEVEE